MRLGYSQVSLTWVANVTGHYIANARACGRDDWQNVLTSTLTELGKRYADNTLSSFVQSVKQEVEITPGRNATKKALAERQAMHARALTTLRRENQQSK